MRSSSSTGPQPRTKIPTAPARTVMRGSQLHSLDAKPPSPSHPKAKDRSRPFGTSHSGQGRVKKGVRHDVLAGGAQNEQRQRKHPVPRQVERPQQQLLVAVGCEARQFHLLILAACNAFRRPGTCFRLAGSCRPRLAQLCDGLSHLLLLAGMGRCPFGHRALQLLHSEPQVDHRVEKRLGGGKRGSVARRRHRFIMPYRTVPGMPLALSP
eukprot:2391436-Prymnesium_polylepis.1